MNFPWLVLGVVGTVAVAGGLGRATRQWFVAAVGASAVIILLQYFYFHYTSDDAYISYRYARNLADGLGPVWNEGERVEGYTNFLWVGIVASMHKLGADIVVSGRWLGYGLAVAAAAGTYAVTREVLPGAPGRVAGFLACVLLAASGAWSMWATAGLEAPLFAALSLAAVLLHFRERPRGASAGWVPASGIAWGLVAMTRPDGILLFATSGVFKLGEAFGRVRTAPNGERLNTGARAALHVLFWAALFAAVYAPYFAWRVDYYGWFFPNTYYAKVGDGIDQLDRGVTYILAFLQESGGWLLLLLPLAIAESAVRRSAAAYVIALTGVWFGYTVWVGGDSLLRFRFLAPVLPFYYSIIAVTAVAIADRLRSAMPRHRLAAEATATVAVLTAVALTLHPHAVDASYTRGERQAVDDRVAIGRWMRESLPDTTSVALIPVGAFGYESGLRVIDMLGITDEHIAHRDLDLGASAAGHEKYDSDYVIDQGPAIILLFDSLTAEPVSQADYSRLVNVFIPAANDMIRNPRLFDSYERRTVQIGDKWLNLLVRRDARALLAMTERAPV